MLISPPSVELPAGSEILVECLDDQQHQRRTLQRQQVGELHQNVQKPLLLQEVGQEAQQMPTLKDLDSYKQTRRDESAAARTGVYM